MRSKWVWTAACMAALLFATPLWAAEEQSNAELAKQIQNPIADLISFPFQNQGIEQRA